MCGIIYAQARTLVCGNIHPRNEDPVCEGGMWEKRVQEETHSCVRFFTAE